MQRTSTKSLMVLLISTILIFTFFSCKTTKKVGKDVQIVKSNDGNETPIDKIPTDSTTVTKPDNSNKNDPNSRNTPFSNPMEKTYNIGLLLPLDAQSGTINNSQNLRFIQYYSGMKLAGKELAAKGAKINIEVIDTKDVSFKNKLSNRMDLIIGPYASASSESSKNDLQDVINFGKENKITVVSPWYSTSKASENNPYFIQLKPNIREHYNHIVAHLHSLREFDKVVLVGRNNGTDVKWFDYFQQVAKAYLPTKGDRPFDELLVNENSLATDEPVFKSKLHEGKSIFIFPNYSYNDENYLVAALTKLTGERMNKNITVYGMPLILDSEKIGFNFYSTLNMRLVVPEFVEKDNEEVKEFTKAFYDYYKTIPAADAFEGHDIMSYFGNALITYGNDFSYKLPNDRSYFLQTAYDVRPVYPEGDDTFEKVQFFENKHLDIIEFKISKFIRL